MKITSHNDWMSVKTDDTAYSKELFANMNKDIVPFFEGNIMYDKKGFFARRGFGPKYFNEFTLSALSLAVVQTLKTKEESLFLIAHDGTNGADYFCSKMASVLREVGIKGAVINANSEVTIPQASFIIQRLKMGGGIFYGRDKRDGRSRVSVINENGYFVKGDTYDKINAKMDSMDPLTINKSMKPNVIVDAEILKQYYDDLNTHKLRVEDTHALRILVTPQFGASKKYLEEIILKQNVSQFFTADVTTPKHEDVKYYLRNRKQLKKARTGAILHKCDYVFAVNNFGTKVNTFIRKGFKLIEVDEDHINALYLTFMINELKEKGKSVEGMKVVIENKKNTLTRKVIERNKLEVIDEYDKKENILIGFGDFVGYYFNDEFNNFPDAFVSVVCLVDMLNYFKTQRQSLQVKINGLIKQYE